MRAVTPVGMALLAGFLTGHGLDGFADLLPLLGTIGLIYALIGALELASSRKPVEVLPRTLRPSSRPR